MAFVLLYFTNSNAQEKRIVKQMNLCNTLEINGPSSLNAFSSNITYSVVSNIFGLPSGYSYQWSTSNNNNLQIISGNGTPNINVNYVGGDADLYVFIIKDATSASCCITKTIIQADIPPNYTIVATSCPKSTDYWADCEQNSMNWSFKLVNETGVQVTGVGVSWPANPSFFTPLTLTPIDNITSTNGTSMVGNNSDCYPFTVVCKISGIYYYGSFATPAMNSSETCNSRYASSSGYVVNNNGFYALIATGSRQTLIDNSYID